MRGTFTKWEVLSRPVATPNKLLRLNYVQTVTGDIYEYQYTQTCTSGCWAKVNTLPARLDANILLPLKDCEDAFDIPSVNRFSDSVIECRRSGTGISLMLQAIDRDGNIQMWRKGQDDFGDPIMLLMSPFVGAILGFVITIVVLMVILFIGSVKSLVSKS